MVEHQLPKLNTRVRFPSSAPLSSPHHDHGVRPHLDLVIVRAEARTGPPRPRGRRVAHEGNSSGVRSWKNPAHVPFERRRRSTPPPPPTGTSTPPARRRPRCRPPHRLCGAGTGVVTGVRPPQRRCRHRNAGAAGVADPLAVKPRAVTSPCPAILPDTMREIPGQRETTASAAASASCPSAHDRPLTPRPRSHTGARCGEHLRDPIARPGLERRNATAPPDRDAPIISQS